MSLEITHSGDDVTILGGAGSGKTATLIGMAVKAISYSDHVLLLSTEENMAAYRVQGSQCVATKSLDDVYRVVNSFLASRRKNGVICIDMLDLYISNKEEQTEFDDFIKLMHRLYDFTFVITKQATLIANTNTGEQPFYL